MNPTQFSDSGTAYRVWGSGRETIVIDTALGTCSAEWWHIAEILSAEFKVITFDRLGCGGSAAPTSERTSHSIAAELDSLLVSLIEELWQDIMKRVLHLSSNAKHINAPKSGHFIHLTDFDVVYRTLGGLTS